MKSSVCSVLVIESVVPLTVKSNKCCIMSPFTSTCSFSTGVILGVLLSVNVVVPLYVKVCLIKVLVYLLDISRLILSGVKGKNLSVSA